MNPIVPPAIDSAPLLAGAADLHASLPAADAQSLAVNVFDIFNSYSVVFVAAFFVTLLATPLARRIALAGQLVDHPDLARKGHQSPVPYLGGLAVFAGLIAAIAVSYVYYDGATALFAQVPLSIVVGMFAITFTGLADDIWGWDPRLKIAGQLVAAAALAIENIGVRVAAGMLAPLAKAMAPLLGNDKLIVLIPGLDWKIDLIYWTGTAIIAIFVLGGCNAANLLDGLDGLLSGVIGIVAVGLLAISTLMAVLPIPTDADPGTVLTGARLVLSFALLGAVLGFLPHNFNPASIFLGDSGSLLLGFVSVTIILMLGELGQTHLVFAGLIVFSVPIMDTTLAIVRRRLNGRPMSAADNQHIHHQLKRALGGVRRAVFALYGISALFAALGVTLAALSMFTSIRLRVVYVVALVLFSFIGVIAIKAARRQQLSAAVQAALQPSARDPMPQAPRPSAPTPATPVSPASAKTREPAARE